ncbi:RtcB family protein [Candidatus Woesearchaeota archaeon]|nr:RtcB family protein [Candidatus Woesearchaeota archaeon]
MTEEAKESGELQIQKLKKCIYDIRRKNGKIPCHVFASEKLLEDLKKDKSLEQGINMTSMPGLLKYSIMMPDAHQGYGFPVGGVAAFDMDNGCISPGGIGYDINCGVRVLISSFTKDQVMPKIKELVHALFQHIHCGVGSESNVHLSKQELDEVLNKGMQWAFEKGYATQDDLNHCEEYGRMKTADSSTVSERAKARGKNQLGTLGAGNHFCEVQYVDHIYDAETAKAFGLTQKGQIVIMIHSGSRGLGHQVCTDYLDKIDKELKPLIEQLPDRELAYAPTGHPLAKQYLKAMSAAANYGWCNRQLITHNAREAFKQVFGKDAELKLLYDVAHNICKIEEYDVNGEKKKVYVHRKGATRAFGPGRDGLIDVFQKTGQPILIPGSMGTASYILVGTDLAREETFSSTPHGAGRVMSRHEANKLFTAEQITKQLEENHIYIKSSSWRGITEEAPKAYKDIDEVVQVSHDVGIGKLVVKLRPIGVIKG